MSDSPTALPLVSRSDALRARSCALLGTVDLTSFDVAVPFEQVSATDRVVWRAPGIELRVDPTRAGWSLDGDRLTVCIGGDARGVQDRIHMPTGSQPLTFDGRGAVIHVDRARGVCLLATDRFAVQPLCFALTSNTLRFSDRADAVLPADERKVDPQAIYNYFYFHVIPSPRTIFRGVERLGPSELLTATSSGLKRSRHWRPRFNAGAADIGALKSEFREAVRGAVAQEATGAAGCFLSGGTDSSTVAGMLSRLRGEPIRAFSIGFDAAGYDEMAYARIAARHFGLEHYEYYVTPADLVRAMPQVAAHFDQPFGNSSAVPAHYCALLAKSYGVTRMLAGDGGDELFGGNSRYAKQKVFDAYGAVPRALRTSLIEPLLLGPGWTGRVPVVRKAVSYVKQAKTPMPDRAAAYNLLEYIGAARVLAPGLLEQVDTDEPLALQRAVYADCNARSPVDRELAFDWRFTLADNDLPKVVGSTELAGLQAAFPLLSDAIVDLSLRLPASHKVRGLTLRHFFKSALSDFLPQEILRKKKHGFGLPFGQWLVRDRALHSYARSSVERLAERGIIRAALPGEVFDTLLPQHPKYYGELVWIMTMLEGWMTVHHPERNGL